MLTGILLGGVLSDLSHCLSTHPINKRRHWYFFADDNCVDVIHRTHLEIHFEGFKVGARRG